jgi:glycine/D-amino acid oxidase-like deaminating enzyme
MISATPITFPGPAPVSSDVVVTGGGIIGVMTARFRAGRGVCRTLCKKRRVAGEEIDRNWGWIRQTGLHTAELPLVIESLRIWQGLAQAHGDAGGFARLKDAFARAIPALGRPAGHEMPRFRLSRLSDGSRLQLGPSL